MRKIFDDLRYAGATARTMLVAVAAKRWKVSPAECEARDQAVFHNGTQRVLQFGELAH